METINIENVKKILEVNFPIYNNDKTKFTMKGLIDNDKRQLFIGDIVWFEYGMLKEKYRGILMFGEYQMWIFGTKYKLLGFYILPMEKKIELNYDICKQMINEKLVYGGNILEGQKKIQN